MQTFTNKEGYVFDSSDVIYLTCGQRPSVETREEDITKPIGEVTIGRVNPANLTEEEFLSSPDIFFHGTDRDFDYSQDFDYTVLNSPRSQMLGPAFYATPIRHDAELFAEQFSRSNPTPTVKEVLPYEAKMFDFRNANDLSTNAPVPGDMLAEYKSFCAAKYAKEFVDYDPNADLNSINPTQEVPSAKTEGQNEALDKYFQNDEEMSNERLAKVRKFKYFNSTQEYLSTLTRLSKQSRVNLREMLSLMGDREASEYGGPLFKDFMLQKGFDGVIYQEGGDHKDHKNPVTYAFYNPKKVGTLSAWTREKAA